MAFADEMTVYTENQRIDRYFLGLRLSKLAGYKSDNQNHFFILQQQLENGLFKDTMFTIASERNKYLRINLKNYVLQRPPLSPDRCGKYKSHE